MTSYSVEVRHTTQCVTDIYVCGYCFHHWQDGRYVSPDEVTIQHTDGRYFNRHGEQVIPFSKILL